MKEGIVREAESDAKYLFPIPTRERSCDGIVDFVEFCYISNYTQADSKGLFRLFVLDSDLGTDDVKRIQITMPISKSKKNSDCVQSSKYSTTLCCSKIKIRKKFRLPQYLIFGVDTTSYAVSTHLVQFMPHTSYVAPSFLSSSFELNVVIQNLDKGRMIYRPLHLLRFGISKLVR